LVCLKAFVYKLLLDVASQKLYLDIPTYKPYLNQQAPVSHSLPLPDLRPAHCDRSSQGFVELILQLQVFSLAVFDSAKLAVPQTAFLLLHVVNLQQVHVSALPLICCAAVVSISVGNTCAIAVNDSASTKQLIKNNPKTFRVFII
jgi:hypothetical protein